MSKIKDKANRGDTNGGARKGRAVKWIALLGATALLVLVLGANFLGALPGGDPTPHPVVGGETRPVLPAHLFPLRTGLAYAAAAKHPEAMDQVYCYCKCDRSPFNHKSLLSCFTESHGAS